MNVVCFRCSEEMIMYMKELMGSEINIIMIKDAWDVKNYNHTEEIRNLAAKTYVINSIDSIEEMATLYVELLEDFGKIDNVISAPEYSMYASGLLLALTQNNLNCFLTAIATRDKRFMKRKYAESNIKHAKYISSFCLEKDELKKVTLDYPLVAKPVAGLGSYYTEILNSAEDLKEYFSKLDFINLDAASSSSYKTHNITLEEYIEGDEFHLDCVIQNGECKTFIISKYFTPRIKLFENDWNKMYLNGSYVINEESNSKLYSLIKEQFYRLLENIELERGVTHTEFFIDQNGEIVFSEIAKRFAGAYVVENVEIATGNNILKQWIQAELGVEVAQFHGETNNNNIVGWTSLCPTNSGYVVNTPKREDYLGLDGVLDAFISIKEGDYIDVNDISEWNLVLIISAKNEEDFQMKLENIYEKNPIVTSKKPK